MIAAPAGAAQPRPSVEIAAESADGAAKGLTVPATGDKAGELTLPLLVREPGQLVVTWVDAANDAVLTLGKDSQPLSRRITGDPRKAGSVLILKLSASAVGESAPALDGLLSIRTGSGMPLVRRVKTGSAEATGDAAPKPTQDKVTVASVRPFPFFSDYPTERVEVGMTVPGGGKSDESSGPPTPLGKGYLALGDRGSRATVKVSAPYGDGPAKRSKVTVSDVSGRGEGAAKIPLGEGEDAASLEVEVMAYDGPLGALLVIVLGALVGGYLPVFLDLRNQGRKLSNELRDAVEKYDEARDKPSPLLLGLVEIDEMVGTLDEWPEQFRFRNWASWPRRHDLAKKSNGEAIALDYRLSRALRTKRLRDDAKAAANLIDTVEGWVAVRLSLVELAAPTAESQELIPADASPAQARPLDDSRDLLAREIEVDADIGAAEAIAAAARRQTAAMKLIVSIHEREPAGDVAVRYATAAAYAEAEAAAAALGRRRRQVGRGAAPHPGPDPAAV